MRTHGHSTISVPICGALMAASIGCKGTAPPPLPPKGDPIALRARVSPQKSARDAFIAGGYPGDPWAGRRPADERLTANFIFRSPFQVQAVHLPSGTRSFTIVSNDVLFGRRLPGWTAILQCESATPAPQQLVLTMKRANKGMRVVAPRLWSFEGHNHYRNAVDKGEVKALVGAEVLPDLPPVRPFVWMGRPPPVPCWVPVAIRPTSYSEWRWDREGKAIGAIAWSSKRRSLTKSD